MKSTFLSARIASCGLAMLALAACVSPVCAQGPQLGFEGLNGLPGAAGPKEIELSASLVSNDPKPGAVAVLTVTAVLPESYYIYSTNPKLPGPTKIRVIEALGLEPIDEEFRADREPEVEHQKDFDTPTSKGIIEKFYQSVTWFRRYRIAERTDGHETTAGEISAVVKFEGQYCGGHGAAANCIPIRPPRVLLAALRVAELPESIRAKVEEAVVYPLTASITPTRKLGAKEIADPIHFEVALTPENAKPGERVQLSVRAKLTDPAYHTFAIDHPNNSGRPTVLDFSKVRNLKPLGPFEPDQQPKIEHASDGKEQRLHFGEVAWSREFEVTQDGGYGVDGSISYQICRETSCNPPHRFPVRLGAQPVASVQKAAAKVDLKNFVVDIGSDDPRKGSLGLYLLYAFIGGMILNVMPCVLPVIAIKVLSFVQQAGESRARIFSLNAMYSVGVISVFMILATLSVGPQQLGWGGLFQKPEFNLIMACLVFAMGLSLLGVFEIPVPGFVGSAAGHQHQEGLAGAYLTGIFATLLATPCSGPFLGATLAWSVQQPKEITYLVWFVMGLGMAFPYLLFGLFPAAVRWLPKPGPWMVRFKEFSGFVLMGSVVFIVSVLNAKYIIPLLIMLVGTSLGLWMIGNLYDFNSHIRHKMLVRVAALSLTGLICWLGYGLSRADNAEQKLPWQPFTEASLGDVIGEKTVLVDFTADWCLTCKLNERSALNTARTRDLVKRYDIIPLYADYTNQSPEIKKWLDTFKSISVPLTVIFPAHQPNRPILLRDLYTESALHQNLERAVALKEEREGAGSKKGESQASRSSAEHR